SWTEEEVISRWKMALGTSKEKQASPQEISQWRVNLCNISWFMRFMNEYIARLANREDDVKGRFWEGRFRSQALVDEGALLACMAYVDLNPIRAKMASCMEDSQNTSIQERLVAYRQEKEASLSLLAFQKTSEEKKFQPVKKKPSLPFSRDDYFALIDWSGRQIRTDKSGFIATTVPTIIAQQGLSPQHWITMVNHYPQHYPSIGGAVAHIKAWASKIGFRWIKGQTLANTQYLTTT
ncbi:MAG: hypothetical protein K2X37_05470, partial [Chitinophagaceae bacterium]|nr:hypothetical protein [Chitinophagaceae bacterium]